MSGDARSACVDIAGASQFADSERQEPAAVWIACVAIVFAFYGHRIRQPRIVADAYGDLTSVEGRQGFTVARSLDRMWTDDAGEMFRVAVEALYDSSVPGARPAPVAMAESLAAGDPVILWASDHPVVLSSLEIARSNDVWSVRGGGVFDPTPKVGRRQPNERETNALNHGGPQVFAMRLTFPGLG